MEKIEKIRPITLTDNGTNTKYTLEFNRESVVAAERGGFIPEEIDTKPVTMIPLLFHYAFRMHHPEITRSETDIILLDKLGGLSPELLVRLVSLYDVPRRTLISGGETKNSKMAIEL